MKYYTKALAGLKVVRTFSIYTNHDNNLEFSNGLVIPITSEVGEAIQRFNRKSIIKEKTLKETTLRDYINQVVGSKVGFYIDKRKNHWRMKPVWLGKNEAKHLQAKLHALQCTGVKITATFENISVPAYRYMGSSKNYYTELIIRTTISPSNIIIS